MAKTGLPNFVLEYTAQWRGIPKVFRITSNHSGSPLTALADVLSLLQYWDGQSIKPFFATTATTMYLSGWKYYDGLAAAAKYEAEYANAAASVTAGFAASSTYGSAYVTGDTGVCGLETCVVLQAPLGLSKSGRPVFMRKYIHGVQASATETDTPNFSTAATAAALKLGDGSAPFNRVLASPSGGQGSWVPYTYYGVHKLSRKAKKKVASPSGLDSLLLDAAKIRGVLGLAADAAAL